jgi:hypothetical protein
VTEVVVLPSHRGISPNFVTTASHDGIDHSMSKSVV